MYMPCQWVCGVWCGEYYVLCVVCDVVSVLRVLVVRDKVGRWMYEYACVDGTRAVVMCEWNFVGKILPFAEVQAK